MILHAVDVAEELGLEPGFGTDLERISGTGDGRTPQWLCDEGLSTMIITLCLVCEALERLEARRTELFIPHVSTDMRDEWLEPDTADISM